MTSNDKQRGGEAIEAPLHDLTIPLLLFSVLSFDNTGAKKGEEG